MLMLFDRDESFIASLKYKHPERKREINGLNILELETDKEVEFGQRLVFKDRQGIWHEYIIFDYFKSHDEEGLTYEVYCEDNTSELYGHYIDDLKPREEAAISILRRVLNGTRFEPGYVDDFGKRSFNLYRTNVKAALWKILEEYGAEIQVRLDVGKDGIKHRYIDLKKSIGRDTGKRFTYRKDMGSIKKTTSTKELATALYGFGKGEEVVGEDGQPTGGYGRKIDFAEINGGKKYVEDEEARLRYGIGPDRMHIFGIADFEDCEDRAELLELTKARLKEVSKPKISYELSVEDISRYEGFEGEAVGLGDVVLVDDKEIDTLVQTRIIAIKDNPLEEIEDSEITLGNFIKDLSSSMVEYDQLKSSFESDRNKFNEELKKLANGVKTSYMQEVLERFNKELNETGGWVYAEEGEGLLILNAPKDGNPTQAINLKGGKIAIANHKNPDGSFAYETFGDGDGFTANLIRAGILRGGHVEFDLENGTFFIGENLDNFSMFWDGKTLRLRNVDIDLSNNYQISEINKKINNNANSFNNSIVKLDKKFNTNITNLENSIDSRFTEASEETDNKIKEIGSNVATKLSNITGEIETVRQDFKVGQSLFESSIDTKIKNLSADVEVNFEDVKKRINGNVTGISNLSSQIKQTESSITQSVANQIKAVNDKISTESSGIRSYVQNNYSTKTQTSDLIKSEISSVKTIIANGDKDVKSYIENNYSTKTQTTNLIENKVSSINSRLGSAETRISQTNSKIESEISSVKSTATSNYNALSSRMRQTESSISTKVSSSEARSIFRQEAGSFTFDAKQVNFNSDVSVRGTFISTGMADVYKPEGEHWGYTYREKRTVMLESGSIKFKDEDGREVAQITTNWSNGVFINKDVSIGGALRAHTVNFGYNHYIYEAENQIIIKNIRNDKKYVIDFDIRQTWFTS